MKSVTYTCDVCGRTIDPNDLYKLNLNGVDKDLDSTCMKTVTAVFTDGAAWEAAREKQKLADAAVREAPEG